MVEETIRNALDCTRYSPDEDRHKVNPGMSVGFRKEIAKLVDEEISVDIYEYRITKGTLITSMWELVLELGGLLRKDPDLDIEQTFERLKRELYRETIGAPLITYTVAFPLNLLRMSEPGDSFQISDVALTRISRDEWKNQYENPALKDDSFKRFLTRESPNSLEPDRFGNETFSFWIVDYPARDPGYASFAVLRWVRLFIAQLNFVHHKRYRALPRPAGDRPGYLRWSPLREPFCGLVYDGGEFIRYQAVDFDYRRRSLMPTEDIDWYKTHLREIPDLNPIINRDEDGGNLDTNIVDALLAYQDGITTATPQKSFFSFWRGVENLTYVKPEQPNSYVYERAESLFQLKSRGEYIPWHERDAMDDLSDRRNDIAHTGSHIHIENSHRTITKRILDKLLEFHFNHYREFDADDMRTFLDCNSHSIESNTQRYSNNKRENELLRYIMLLKADAASDQSYIG